MATVVNYTMSKEAASATSQTKRALVCTVHSFSRLQAPEEEILDCFEIVAH